MNKKLKLRLIENISVKVSIACRTIPMSSLSDWRSENP
jgi:hypothetical protein